TNYYSLERGEPAAGAKETPASLPGEAPSTALADSFFDETADTQESPPESGEREEALGGGANRREGENEAEGRQRRRRRRRRGRGGDREGSGIAANAPQPPDDALEAMAKIGGLHPSAALESDAEAGEIALAGDDEPMASHQDMGRRSRGDGRRPRKTPGNSDAEPEPAPSDVTGGIEADEGRSPAGRARRGRRAPREPRTRSARAGELAATPNATSAFIADDVQDRHQTPDIAPQTNDENQGKVTASPGRVKVDERETPQSAPSD